MMKGIKSAVMIDENGNKKEVYIVYRGETEAQKRASKKYRDAHKERYAQLKREKYQSDPLFREKYIQRVKDSYQKRKWCDIDLEFKRLAKIKV